MSIGNHARTKNSDILDLFYISTLASPFCSWVCFSRGFLAGQAGSNTVTSSFWKSSVFTVQTKTRKCFFFLISTLDSVFEKLRFWSPFSQDTRGRKANPQRERCVFKRKRIRVDRAKICFCNAFLFVRHPAFGMLFAMLRLHWTIVHETIHKPNFWGRCSLLQPYFSEMFRPIPPKIQMCIRMR